MSVRTLKALLLVCGVAGLGDRPTCSESSLYEGWPKVRWDELYDSPRPEPNIGGCTTLDLEDARLGEAEVTSVLAAITANMSLVDDLRHLRLGGIDLRPEPVMTPLTALVAASTSLSSLSVARGNLIAGAAAPLILAARRHASLARLELEWNELGDAGATALATEVLAVGDAGALTTLRLQRNGVGDVGGAALGDALRSNSVLRSLQLEGNGIGPAGAAAIAAGLAENEALTHLGMELNPIGAEGARLIGQSLTANEQLLEFSCSGCGVGDDGITAIASALRANARLQVLKLERNGITDAGAVALAGTLRVNSGLRVLDLRGNYLGDTAARAFATTLVDNTVLHEIRLGQNFVLPALGKVGEGETEISTDLLDDLRALLARNRELAGRTGLAGVSVGPEGAISPVR